MLPESNGVTETVLAPRVAAQNAYRYVNSQNRQ